jgi:hypothetical protein
MTTKLFRVLRKTPGDNFRFAAPSRSNYFASSKRQLSSTCFPVSANPTSSPKTTLRQRFHHSRCRPRHADYTEWTRLGCVDIHLV